MMLDLQRSAPPPIPKPVITPWPGSQLVPLPFPTGTGTLRYLNIKAGGGRMDRWHTYRLVSYTHFLDCRGDERGALRTCLVSMAAVVNSDGGELEQRGWGDGGA